MVFRVFTLVSGLWQRVSAQRENRRRSVLRPEFARPKEVKAGVLSVVYPPMVGQFWCITSMVTGSVTGGLRAAGQVG